MSIEQFEIINEILLKVMEELASINKKLEISAKGQNEIKEKVHNIDEIQEVLRKELSIYDLNQMKWQIKIEKDLAKLQKDI